MNILMLSMDETILTGTLGDSRARHEEYARRFGTIQMVVCNVVKGGKPLAPLHTERLIIQPTNSRSRLWYVPDAVRAARTLAAELRPNVITSQDALLTGLAGLWIRRVLHAPLIVQDHTAFADNPYWARESRQNRLLQKIAQFVIPRADVVRVVNRGEREACIRIGAQPERVAVVPVPIPLAQFTHPDQRIDWRARFGLTAEQPVALWVGRPVPFKNLGLLLAAWQQVAAKLPAARLILAGSMDGTPYPAQVQALGLADSVILAGRVAYDDLPSLYQTANIYVHSSTYEGGPRVQVEAAAAGIPSVSTDCDGPRDIIKHGETGLLTPMCAPELAAAILSLLSDPARARQMGQAACTDILERYDQDRLIDQWVGLWRSTSTLNGKATGERLHPEDESAAKR
jgi:glycosyltransferase involved in cell wall biosynthesis